MEKKHRIKTVQFLRLNKFTTVDVFMSASLDMTDDWNFRIFDKRLVIVKTKDEGARKVIALDVQTNQTLPIELPDMISMQELLIDKEYMTNLRVYTSKNLEGIGKDSIDFFEALDIDQTMDDFINAYWIYPSKVRFELMDFEEP